VNISDTIVRGFGTIFADRALVEYFVWKPFAMKVVAVDKGARDGIKLLPNEA
jgi:hypothetical protein